jgi:hypothetical protein
VQRTILAECPRELRAWLATEVGAFRGRRRRGVFLLPLVCSREKDGGLAPICYRPRLVEYFRSTIGKTLAFRSNSWKKQLLYPVWHAPRPARPRRGGRRDRSRQNQRLIFGCGRSFALEPELFRERLQ